MRLTHRPRTWLLLTAFAAAVTLAVVWSVGHAGARHDAPGAGLPVRVVGAMDLPGDDSRFDYASLDTARGLLFIAHLGASEVVEVDVRAHRVVRTIPNLADVHGVLVVPALHRVYATATGHNQMVGLDEDSGAILTRSPTGDYPDGLAYDPVRGAIWTTNEAGGTETVLDAHSGAGRGSVTLGDEVANVAYDPVSDQILVAVQSNNDLAVINPATLAIVRRVPLPGCTHDHGLTLDPTARLAFVACDGNATLLTIDLNTWTPLGTSPVGDEPDVLAYDPSSHRLYVAAESGTLTVLEARDRSLSVLGSDHLADRAHVVAVDPATHHTYYPVPTGPDGHPALLEASP